VHGVGFAIQPSEDFGFEQILGQWHPGVVKRFVTCIYKDAMYRHRKVNLEVIRGEIAREAPNSSTSGIVVRCSGKRTRGPNGAGLP